MRLADSAGSSTPALTWTCSVASPFGGPATWDFTATVTAHSAGSAPVTVSGYTVVISNSAGAEIFSDNAIPMNGTVMPGQSLSSVYERGSILSRPRPVARCRSGRTLEAAGPLSAQSDRLGRPEVSAAGRLSAFTPGHRIRSPRSRARSASASAASSFDRAIHSVSSTELIRSRSSAQVHPSSRARVR